MRLGALGFVSGLVGRALGMRSSAQGVEGRRARRWYGRPDITRRFESLEFREIAASVRLTTPLQVRIITTSDWTTFRAIGDRAWSSSEITAVSGEDVSATAVDQALHLSQPLPNSEAGMVVEMDATVSYVNWDYLHRALHRTASLLGLHLGEPKVEFQIERGHLGWTHVQLLNTLGVTPTVVENYWWSGITNTSENAKQVDTERSSMFRRVRGYNGQPVDRDTLTKKAMFGYQGWFGCPGDGSDMDRWIHWFTNNTASAANLHVDLWPEMGEYEDDERFATGLTLPNGESAAVFSSYEQKSVLRHFEWMEAHDLDGVFAQRFVASITPVEHFVFRNKVLQNAQMGAERTGRTFAVMYDISGGTNVQSRIMEDWEFLTEHLGISDSPAYLHHDGRPIVAVWGPGFYTRDNITAAETQDLIDWFKSNEITIMGGVPTRWREQGGDTSLDPAWAAVFRSYDIISPWSVGRYSDASGITDFRTTYLEPDVAEAAAVGAAYMPVIWPGFSWRNLHDGATPTNQIPRDGGRFFNLQSVSALGVSGIDMIYIAMFDEVDEGTAMFKLAEDASAAPTGVDVVTLDADGFNLHSDSYLRLARSTTLALRSK